MSDDYVFLRKQNERLRIDNQAYIAENIYLRRKIECLMDMTEDEKLKDLREGNRSPYRRDNG